MISLLLDKLKNVASDANNISDGDIELRKSGTLSAAIAIDTNKDEFFTELLSRLSMKFKKNTMIKNDPNILIKFNKKHLHR